MAGWDSVLLHKLRLEKLSVLKWVQVGHLVGNPYNGIIVVPRNEMVNERVSLCQIEPDFFISITFSALGLTTLEVT